MDVETKRPSNYLTSQYSFVLLILIVLALFSGFRNSLWHSDISLWQDVVRLSASKGRAHNDLAMAEFRAGRAEQAISGFKKALTLGEGLAMVHSNLGVAYMSVGRFKDALTEQARAITLMPVYAPAYTNQGIALYALGRTEASLQSFREAAVLTELPREQHNLANALRRARRLDEAVEAFRALLSVYKTPAIHNDLGLALAAKGEHAASRVEYENALALDNNYVNALINMAALYLREGDGATALKNYNLALTIEPRNAILHYHLGLFYERADNNIKARIHYEKFMRLAGVKERRLAGQLKERFFNK